MDDRLDSISNCKIMISYYDTYWEKQIQRQISCQVNTKWIQKRITKTYSYSKINYGKGES